tara:strand:+ start:2627 stop:2920 length:294 start_codon:yes stop_codon:yes gene_type:complete
MVAPIVAAVAPSVIESATDNEGIVNKLFKLGILVAVFGIIIVALFTLNYIIGIADLVGATIDVFKVGTSFAFNIGPLAPIATGLSVLFSAFGFGGRK